MAAMRKQDKNRLIPTDYITGNVDIAKSPLKYLMDKEDWQIIDMALCSLEPRTEKIVRAYYGFDRDPICCREIGKELMLSGSRIQQLIHRAIRQFRHPAARKILQDCLNAQSLAERGYGAMPARHYVPDWKRPILAHVNKYRYSAYYDFDLRAFLQGKMSTKEMTAYFSTKQ